MAAFLILPYQLDFYRITERGAIRWLGISRPPGRSFAECLSQLEDGMRALPAPSMWDFSNLYFPYSMN